MSRNDPIDIEVIIIRDEDSDAAILVSETGDEDDVVWLPRSQIEYTTDRHGRTTVTLPEWLGIEKGLL
jgi:hypothetical protein